MIKRTLRTLSAAALMSLAAVAHAAPVDQLGFLLDASGSVSTTNYNKLRVGLNAAIAGLPQDGTIEISVVTFASSASTVVAPTILDSTTLAAIQTAITTHSKSANGGLTDTAEGITKLTAELTGSANFADPGTRSFINLATDGRPNTPGSSRSSSQTAAETAAQAAALAGIDSLSIEAIGSGVSSATQLANALAITFPGPATILAVNETNIPTPLNGSWVVPVTDFDAYASVVDAKVQAIVNDVPEPGVLALGGIGLFGMLAGRRRRSARG